MLAAVAGDGFEAGSFSGGTGQWQTGGWTVTGDASLQTSGQHTGSYHARLRSGTGDVQRSIDVSGLSDVKLQFWSKVSSFEGNDQARVQVSGNGSSWTTLQTFAKGQSDDQYHFHQLTVPNLGSTLYVRFDAAMNATNDNWYLDDIALTATPTGPPTISIDDVQLAESALAVKIAHQTGGGPTLSDGDHFGQSVASIGDLDGDGIDDLAVGAWQDDRGGLNRGALYVQFMNADGTVKSSTKIAHNTGGGPSLADGDGFGESVTSLGDLDGDGITELAVGAIQFPPPGGSGGGEVHILFLNADGTVKSSTKIASGIGGGPTLADGDAFGVDVDSLGDLDGDGVTDVVIGASEDDTGGNARGALYVMFLNPDATAKSFTKIASGMGGAPTLADGDGFGRSVALLGDLDGDGIVDLAVGSRNDSTGGAERGAVHVLFLNTDGTVKSFTKIASDTGGGPTLPDDGHFGVSVASLGDLDADGTTDIAVGSQLNNTGGVARGSVHVLFLNADGTANSFAKIASDTGGGPALVDGDRFGISVESLGDRDGDGTLELAVGARTDDTGGTDRGAVYILSLNNDGVVKGATFEFIVTRTGDTSGASSVDFTTVDGTALAGSDYTAVSGTLQFLPGETSQTISVQIIGDTIDEADETFNVVLSNAVDGVIADAAGVGTIVDDDTPQPVVLFADSFEVSEWNGLWVEDSQNDWFRSSQRATDGTRSAEVDGSASNATLTTAASFDLTGYTSATLTFSWYIESGLDAGEFLALDISTNGGTTWQNDVRRLRGNVDAENVWHHETVDLTPYLSGNLRFRFRATMSGSDEDANVDNVRLVASGPAPVMATIGVGAASQFVWSEDEEDETSILPDILLPV